MTWELPPVRLRRERIHKLYEFLKEHQDLPVEQLLCAFAYHTGLKRSVVRDYVEILIHSGFMKIKNGKAVEFQGE